MAIDERKRLSTMPQPAKLSRVSPTDVSPQRRAQAAMYAPVTNHFSPDAALGALVDAQNPGAGAIGPPSPMATPPRGFLSRVAPSSADAIAFGSTPRQGESMPEAVGRYTAGAAGIATAVPEALVRAGADVATGAYGAAKGFIGGLTGAPPTAATQAPAGLFTNGVAPTMTAPPTMTGKATVDVGIAPKLDAFGKSLGNIGAQSGPAMAARALSDKGNALPGAPTLGADGSIQYDDAFAARNKPLLQRYANQNVVQSVVPAPGVAQSMMGGGTPEIGKLARAPQGYTAADRMQQLDNLDSLGTSYARGQARDASAKASASAANALKRGDLQAAAAANQQAQTAGASAQGMAQPPRIGTLNRVDPNDAARNAIDEQRVAMEQQQSQVSTDAQRLQLQQTQQMQGLTDKLISGTPEERTAAAASMAALQGTKPGEPIKVKRTFDTGAKDIAGAPIMGSEEVLYDPRSGQWIQPPAAGGQAQSPPPQAIQHLRDNDTPQMREAFKAKYGVDPAKVLA